MPLVRTHITPSPSSAATRTGGIGAAETPQLSTGRYQGCDSGGSPRHAIDVKQLGAAGQHAPLRCLSLGFGTQQNGQSMSPP
jgi:hypothetical protein